jgi:hypothetical protein
MARPEDVPVASTYGLAVMLPEREEEALRQWTRHTPGSSYDTLGSHISLLTFHADVTPSELSFCLRRTTSSFAPFAISLCHVKEERYWGMPDRQIVMLTPDDSSMNMLSGIRQRLLSTLSAELPGFHQEDIPGPFLPHLTLTTGLDQPSASTLAQHAAELRIDFLVQSISVWSRNHCGADRTWFVEALPLKDA